MGTGGSRCGAGRPALHVKAEHCRQLDVRRWQREGVLRPGYVGSWHWTDRDTGEERASIGFRTDQGAVTLRYLVDGMPCSQTVRLSDSACNYGGARPWFVCPIHGERVAALFLRAGRFACRPCQRIAYASQSDDLCARIWRRQQKAEAKLGPYWARPKGMHEATRERLLSIIWDCEEQRNGELANYLAGMMRRYPSLRDDPAIRNMA